MTLQEANKLARRSNYGMDAVEIQGNPINWADAEAFFLEGYLHNNKENIELRKILVECARAIGCSASMDSSIEFLKYIPNEINLKLTK